MSSTWRGAMLVSALIATPFLHAQSLTVMPATASVNTGATIQFTKQSMLLSPETVTWSVAGIPSGNTTVGTIDATGLYKAPAAVPSPNRVRVTATSTAMPSIVANTYVTATA